MKSRFIHGRQARINSRWHDTSRSQLFAAGRKRGCAGPTCPHHLCGCSRTSWARNHVNLSVLENEANSRPLRHLRGLINAAGVNYVPEKRPNCRQSSDAARRGSFQAISRESLRWSTVDSKRDRSTCLRAKQTNRSDPETGYTRDFGETVEAGCLGRSSRRDWREIFLKRERWNEEKDRESYKIGEIKKNVENNKQFSRIIFHCLEELGRNSFS